MFVHTTQDGGGSDDVMGTMMMMFVEKLVRLKEKTVYFKAKN